MSKGEYTLTLDTENGIVRIVVHGEFGKELDEEIITNARTVAAKQQYHILYDVRHADAKVTIADWFYLPRSLEVLENIETRFNKAAVLISPGNHI